MKFNSVPKGIYPPVITPFKASNEDLDLETLEKHITRIIQAGCAGVVVMGSNGEAATLSPQERIDIIKTARKAINATNPNAALIAGTGTQSTRQTIELNKDAANAGADFTLILTPSYFSSNMTPDAIDAFFNDVADASPIPIMIYNYPGVTAGIDLSSDVISKLAQHPTIVGCKLTCGNVGKLTRIVAATKDVKGGFSVFGGFADFLLPALSVGSSGAITGLANICPKAIVQLYKTATTQLSQGNLTETASLQAAVSRADWAVIKTGVPGTKYALTHYFGYGGVSRKPLLDATSSARSIVEQELKEIMEIEKSL